MRILFVADIHYSLKQLDWVYNAAPGFDLVIIGGDLLDLAGHADLDTQIVVIAKYLERLGAKLPIAVCSGNHDLDIQTENGERKADWLVHLDLRQVSVDHQSLLAADWRFSVCPWWDGPESQKEVADFLAAEAKKDGRPWIWIYHAPPDGAKTGWNGKNYSGDAFLTALIHEHKPDMVLSGHIHGSPFRKEGRWIDRVGDTWVFNPGRQPSAIPSTIVFDLDKMEATWNSEMDVETLSLSADANAQSPGSG